MGVVLEVSAPYSRTALILVDSCFEDHMFFNCRNTALALPQKINDRQYDSKEMNKLAE